MGLKFETIGGIMGSGSETSDAPAGDGEDDASARKDRHNPKRLAVSFGGSPPSGVPPAKFDWRTMDGTTAVKAQGSCGSWTAADTMGPRAPLPEGWHRKTILVSEHVALTHHVRVRVEVADLPGGSLVEAAIDDFSVS